MKKHSRFNRILSGILAFVLLLPPVPVRAESTQTETGAEVPSAASVAAEPRITREGEAVRKLSLASHERIEILAEHSEADASYQWQILHPEKPDVWINISDATHSDLFVTLALVRNMMKEDQTAQLRCRVTAGGQMRCTDPVTVQYCPDVPYVAEKPSETTPIETEEATVPVETEAPTVPVETNPETVSVETGEATVPVETEAPTVPAETVPESAPVETEEAAVPTETEEPTVPFETIEESAPVETEEAAVPAETEKPTVPVESIPESAPEETGEATVPAETEEPTVTVETIEESAPMETEEATIPAETEVPTVPTETVPESAPVETEEATIPAETEVPTIPAETVPETLPAPVVFVEEAAASVAADVPVNPEASEFVSVIIDYVRFDFARDEKGALIPDTSEDSYHGYQLEEEGTVAFTSYKATLQHGTDLDTKASVPTLVGYTPYLENGTSAITEVAINEANIKEDIRITVKYKPAKVKYTVRYYFQNIYDDLYVEDMTMKIVGEGFTGAMPPENHMKPSPDDVDSAYPDMNETEKQALKEKLRGFTSLFYQPDSIAADGSTVFEVYYERNYYLMEFDCNGGYGTDTLYSRFGSYINVPSPVLAGWLFDYWYLTSSEETGTKVTFDDEDKDPLSDTMPPYNTAYKAKWKTTNTTYTIVYWFADLATEKVDGKTTYSCFGSQRVQSTSNTVLIPADVGQDHPATSAIYPNFQSGDLDETPYFTYDAEATAEKNEATVVVEGDGSTVVNVYYKRKEYTIRFVYAQYRNCWNDSYYLAKSTGCGRYNNATPTNNNHSHTEVKWDYSVSALPTITNSYYSNPERQGVIYEDREKDADGDGQSDQYWYYYIALTAEYGADITDMWPASVIPETEGYDFGSWGADCASDYRRYNAEHANIVGPYPEMSSEMIINPNEAVAQTMVAWWGASGDYVGAHAYHIYLELLPGETYDQTKHIIYEGKYYKLDQSEVFTAAHNGNTRVDPFVYDGFTIHEKQKNGYADSKANEFYHNDCTLDPSLDNNGKDNHDYCNNFYYNRNEYTLSFYNHNDYLQDGDGAKVPYGKDLSVYGDFVNDDYMNGYIDEQGQFVPGHYPAGLEPNAYEFKGWYTTAGCYDGTEMDWDSSMPASNMTVYAKWEPVKRNVKFYTLYEDIDKVEGEEGYHAPFLTATDVPHGSKLGSAYYGIPTAKDDSRIEGYTFIGWFYMDEDNKKRFAPDSMEINRDLVLFAEWKTSIDTTYEIQYVLGSDYSADYPKGTAVADGIFAHASVGMTKTFTAKGNTDLYLPFRKNFYPMVNSHSILMKEEDSENTFTFEYVFDDCVYYKIRYLEASTNKELHEAVLKDTSETGESVVTEKFLPITGYLPQSYYIRKTLAYDDKAESAIEENIITFYYVKDEAHGIYSVEYYLENASGEYTLYENIVGTADKDTMYPPTGTNLIRAYEGYDHDPSQNTVITYNEKGEATENKGVSNENLKGEVTPYGLTFKLYYKRQLYPYSVEYWVAGSDIDADKKFENGFLTVVEGNNTIVPYTGNAYFDTEQSWSLIQKDANGALIRDHSTIVVGNNTYEFYPNDPANAEKEKTKTITIRTDEDENRIIFYFIQKRVAVFYHAVCTEPALKDICGAVSLASEDADTLAGSRAIPKTGFAFKGWYKDEACEESDKVSDDWLKKDDPNHLIPNERNQNTADDDPSNDWINHYYALFEPVKEDITITKTGENLGEDTFLFQVTGTNVLGEAVAMTVSIHSAGSVTIQDLYCGSYTVKELTNWSWDYECTSDTEMTVTLTTGDQDEQGNPITTYQVTFNNEAKTVDWLHGEGSADNQFK